MPDGANKGSFVQGYNAQVAVDAEAQVIVASRVTQAPNDVQQLVPMADAIRQNVGQLPATTSADAGYFSAHNVEDPALAGTNLLVPPDRQKHATEPSAPAPCDEAWCRSRPLRGGAPSAPATPGASLGRPASHRTHRLQRPWHTGQGLGPRATDSGMGTRTGWGSGSLSFCPTHT